MARELARKRKLGLTEAVKLALGNELQRGGAEQKLQRIREIQRKIARLPDTGLKADKAFFDELSGGDD